MATTRPTPRAARNDAFRPRTLALLALGAALAALLAAWALGRLAAGPEPAPGSPDRTADTARRVEVALADVDRVWRRSFPGYESAEVILFTRATPTACAPGRTVSGPFYCAETGTVAVDLAFLDALGRRLGRQREQGLALVAARLASAHLQNETGLLDAASLSLVGAGRARRAEIAASLALQADCLTGAWAALARDRLGPVPEGFWGRLFGSWRNTASDFATAGARLPRELDPTAAGARDDRAAAFARGYAAGAVSACPTPEPIVRG